jgi:peptide/nickel transport system permease protein
MARFILRRAVHAVVLVFITVTATYFVLQLAPGDPLTRYFSPDIDPDSMARVRHQLGLDAPAHVQFLRWLGSAVQGDFGVSLVQHRPVSDILRETIPRTLQLTVLAFLVQLLIGVTTGAYAGSRRGRGVDRALSVSMVVIYAVPAFYLAYLLITFFSLHFDLLPTSGMMTIGVESTGGWSAFADRARHLVLPVLVLGVASAAALARFARGSMVDSLAEDHIRTARAKGVPEQRVVWIHAFRNALPPILTVVGLSVPFLLGGAVVVEKVFAWPGMGSLVVDSIFARDYPVVLATNMVAAALVIAGSFLADVSYVLADPRTKLASPGGDRGSA